MDMLKSSPRILEATLTVCLFIMIAVYCPVARADFGATPNLVPPKGLPSKTSVAQRLYYIVYVPNFSPSHPLTQDDLMKLVWYHAELGDFPKNYIQMKSFNAPPGHFDNFMMRSTSRRFVHTLLGRDLKLWHPSDDNENPTIIGDYLGWWYNTGNSMSEAPFVRITSLNRANGQSVIAKFRVFHRWGNLSNSPPLLQIGVGSATLHRNGSDWIVSSWRVDKNHHWR